MRYLYLAIAALTVAGCLWISDIVSDRQNVVVLTAPTWLYRDFPSSPLPNTLGPGNAALTRLQSGLVIPVRRVRYGKDFMTVQVDAPNGVTGWLICGTGVTLRQR